MYNRWMRLAVAAIVLLAPACTVPEAVHTVEAEAPPPELGRPGWVRLSARVGAWLGALGGGVASVAALPITWPIAQLADEPLGRAKTEFLFAPVAIGASAGHFVFGAPPDAVDFLFRRAWRDEPPSFDYDFVPMRPPQGPEEEDLPAREIDIEQVVPEAPVEGRSNHGALQDPAERRDT